MGKFQFFFLYLEIRLVCFRNENASRKLVVDEIFSNHPPSGVLLIGGDRFYSGWKSHTPGSGYSAGTVGGVERFLTCLLKIYKRSNFRVSSSIVTLDLSPIAVGALPSQPLSTISL